MTKWGYAKPPINVFMLTIMNYAKDIATIMTLLLGT